MVPRKGTNLPSTVVRDCLRNPLKSSYLRRNSPPLFATARCYPRPSVGLNVGASFWRGGWLSRVDVATSGGAVFEGRHVDQENSSPHSLAKSADNDALGEASKLLVSGTPPAKAERTKPQSDTVVEGARAFVLFWEAYPHKVGKSDAVRAYAALAKAPGFDLDAIRCSSVYPRQARRALMVEPCDVSDRRRWEDQPATVAHQPNGPRGGNASRSQSGSHYLARMSREYDKEIGVQHDERPHKSDTFDGLSPLSIAPKYFRDQVARYRGYVETTASGKHQISALNAPSANELVEIEQRRALVLGWLRSAPIEIVENGWRRSFFGSRRPAFLRKARRRSHKLMLASCRASQFGRSTKHASKSATREQISPLSTGNKKMG